MVLVLVPVLVPVPAPLTIPSGWSAPGWGVECVSFHGYNGTPFRDVKVSTRILGLARGALSTPFLITHRVPRGFYPNILVVLTSPNALDAAQSLLAHVGAVLQALGPGPVLRLFFPCALISHAQGSSGVVDTMPFAWRGHTKSLTTRARPSPDLALRLG